MAAIAGLFVMKNTLTYSTVTIIRETIRFIAEPFVIFNYSLDKPYYELLIQ